MASSPLSTKFSGFCNSDLLHGLSHVPWCLGRSNTPLESLSVRDTKKIRTGSVQIISAAASFKHVTGLNFANKIP
eukprot:Gb_08155 [translate_table: standard]